jgi:hypothetical protein
VAQWLGEQPGRLAVGYAGQRAIEIDLCLDSCSAFRQVQIVASSGAAHPLDNAFAIVSKDNLYHECWVRVGECKYRSVYHDYLTQFAGLASNEKLFPWINVDHVLSRKRAESIFETGVDSFVRLMMVDSKINIKFGLFEKFAIPKDFTTAGSIGRANFTWPLAIKVIGLPAPPTSQFADHYIVDVLRRLSAQDLLPGSFLSEPYFVARGAFMSGSQGKTVDNSLCYRGLDGDLLTGGESVALWLSNFNANAGPEKMEIENLPTPDPGFDVY